MFHFKQFSLKHEKSSIKIGTDAVLLGSLSKIANAKRILDIGTGCGVIALMLAQRSEANITGIEIDYNSYLEASENTKQSPFHNRTEIIHISLQQYYQKNETKFDLIVCNPPFFEDSLKPRNISTANAKHNISLSFSKLFFYSEKLLGNNARLNIIFPIGSKENILQIAKAHNLFPRHQIIIHTKRGAEPKRVITEFGGISQTTLIESFNIREQDNNYTEEYKERTKDFHPDF